MKHAAKFLSLIFVLSAVQACRTDGREDDKGELYFTMPDKMSKDETKAYETIVLFQDLSQSKLGPGFNPDVRVVFVGDIVVKGENPSAGLCSYKDKPFVVQLNKRLWSESSDTQKEMLLLHELGHCVLDRRHREGRLPNGGPESLMNMTQKGDDEFYKANKKYYLNELFQNTPFNSKTAGGSSPQHSQMFLERHLDEK